MHDGAPRKVLACVYFGRLQKYATNAEGASTVNTPRLQTLGNKHEERVINIVTCWTSDGQGHVHLRGDLKHPRIVETIVLRSTQDQPKPINRIRYQGMGGWDKIFISEIEEHVCIHDLSEAYTNPPYN